MGEPNSSGVEVGKVVHTAEVEIGRMIGRMLGQLTERR